MEVFPGRETNFRRISDASLTFICFSGGRGVEQGARLNNHVPQVC